MSYTSLYILHDLCKLYHVLPNIASHAMPSSLIINAFVSFFIVDISFSRVFPMRLEFVTDNTIYNACLH